MRVYEPSLEKREPLCEARSSREDANEVVELPGLRSDATWNRSFHASVRLGPGGVVLLSGEELAAIGDEVVAPPVCS